jgi:hypothetical protein
VNHGKSIVPNLVTVEEGGKIMVYTVKMEKIDEIEHAEIESTGIESAKVSQFHAERFTVQTASNKYFIAKPDSVNENKTEIVAVNSTALFNYYSSDGFFVDENLNIWYWDENTSQLYNLETLVPGEIVEIAEFWETSQIAVLTKNNVVTIYDFDKLTLCKKVEVQLDFAPNDLFWVDGETLLFKFSNRIQLFSIHNGSPTLDSNWLSEETFDWCILKNIQDGIRLITDLGHYYICRVPETLSRILLSENIEDEAEEAASLLVKASTQFYLAEEYKNSDDPDTFQIALEASEIVTNSLQKLTSKSVESSKNEDFLLSTAIQNLLVNTMKVQANPQLRVALLEAVSFGLKLLPVLCKSRNINERVFSLRQQFHRVLAVSRIYPSFVDRLGMCLTRKNLEKLTDEFSDLSQLILIAVSNVHMDYAFGVTLASYFKDYLAPNTTNKCLMNWAQITLETKKYTASETVTKILKHSTNFDFSELAIKLLDYCEKLEVVFLVEQDPDLKARVPIFLKLNYYVKAIDTAIVSGDIDSVRICLAYCELKMKYSEFMLKACENEMTRSVYEQILKASGRENDLIKFWEQTDQQEKIAKYRAKNSENKNELMIARGKFKNVNHAKYTASQIGLLSLKTKYKIENKTIGNWADIYKNGDIAQSDLDKNAIGLTDEQRATFSLLGSFDVEKLDNMNNSTVIVGILKKSKIFRNKGNAGVLIKGQFISNQVMESILKRLHIQDHVYLLAWHDPEKAIQTALSDFESSQTVSTIHKSLPSFRKTVGI